jgi:CDP-glucose 4,6-dehydratase
MSFWGGRTTFVTGAAGFLGGWLTKELLSRGARLIVLVRSSSPNTMLVREGLLDRCTVLHGSVHDLELLRGAFAQYSFDTVFHLAAQPLVGLARRDPAGTLETNVRGTWNVLEAARLTRSPQVVLASSGKVYGNSPLPHQEANGTVAHSPYELSKICAELLCAMYSSTYQVPVAVARFANLFGGGDWNFSRAIPGSILATLREQPFVIRSNGKSVRDFLYVRDAALACMTLAEYLANNPGGSGEIFNFSLESKLSIREMVAAVLGLMNRKNLEPVVLNEPGNEPAEEYMLSAKARQLLGWKPAYSFEEGLLETIEWYRSYFHSPESDCATALEAAGMRPAAARGDHEREGLLS